MPRGLSGTSVGYSKGWRRWAWACIVGVANWPAFDTVYAAMLADAHLARTVVPVPELHHGILVEVDAIAARADA